MYCSILEPILEKVKKVPLNVAEGVGVGVTVPEGVGVGVTVPDGVGVAVGFGQVLISAIRPLTI